MPADLLLSFSLLSFSFFNSFIGGITECNKLLEFKSTIHCVQTWETITTTEAVYIPITSKCPRVPLHSFLLSPFSKQLLICFLSLHFLEFYINGMIQYDCFLTGFIH